MSTAGKSDERKRQEGATTSWTTGTTIWIADRVPHGRSWRSLLADLGDDCISTRSWISHRETIAQIVEDAVFDDDGQIQAEVETRGGRRGGLAAARCWATSDVGWVRSLAARSGPASRPQRTLASSRRELRNACESRSRPFESMHFKSPSFVDSWSSRKGRSPTS